MIEYIIVGVIALVMLIVGIFIGKNLGKLKQQSLQKSLESEVANYRIQVENIDKNLQEIKQERENLRSEKDFFKDELTRKNVEFENLQQRNNEQKQEVNQLQEKFQKEFENLAHKIFDQNSQKFSNQNKENIQHILNPLQEKIKIFEEKVEKNSMNSVKINAELSKQLQFLNEQNLKISEEATNLTRALKGDSKMQGNWGEMILERVLERSGLQKNSEYFVQQNFRTEEGKRVMPDVVIKLPGDKKIIIDAKVSLNAYERYVNETDDSLKPLHLKKHIIAVKNRVDELSKKNYHQLYEMESPDFVLLFIPIEAAFAVASNEYPQLYGDAFDKNIILVTPTTLLAVLKTIDSMWQNEKQKQNAIEIASQAGALYDSFVNLTEELKKVGNQIGTVQNTYDKAMKKLTGKGNLVKRVEKLKELGAKASKQIDAKLIDQSVTNHTDL
ncbi:DNA recombination protein RmuC [Mesonia aestuariivivens]|uniref:DNA recombination protein RmuC n=1 Tax=Mesonia aestuariivivens TaxID=2796128 RepID=A0ABS6W0F4_9FLAO|nr:DNA recombination protein RmuC [Mesonia aestuariivivens]MBW2960599.1 DNA recombination protein RmuC [Mesonia aestuariivivens]